MTKYSHSTAKHSFVYLDFKVIYGCVSSCTIELNKLFLHEILIRVRHEKLISVQHEKLTTVHNSKLVSTHNCGEVSSNA